jgi:MinD superfamily P-loop ATPase
MEQINLIQGKGGQGTSVTACAVALAAAGNSRRVRLDGHDRSTLAAILGTGGNGFVTPNLFLGADSADGFDIVIHDGPAEEGTSLLVIRPCYLALRRALDLGVTASAAGVIVITESGRALEERDVAEVTGLPVVTNIPVSPTIARAVDAGILAARLPKDLRSAAADILEFAGTSTGSEVRS